MCDYDVQSSEYIFIFFFFNDTATTEIYTLSLHDALPICSDSCAGCRSCSASPAPIGRTTRSTSSTSRAAGGSSRPGCRSNRSEEHTSELQSRQYLVCRLLLEKKNNQVWICIRILYIFISI